ncbi:unnamed protein product, partial [Larinioides sclopetarius]
SISKTRYGELGNKNSILKSNFKVNSNTVKLKLYILDQIVSSSISEITIILDSVEITRLVCP